VTRRKGVGGCPLWCALRTQVGRRDMSALCRFCCKSRKSNEPENLAKGDFQRAVTSRSVVTPLRRSVVVFPRNDLVPHIVACNTRQRPRKCSFVTPKRLLQQNLPTADIPTPPFPHPPTWPKHRRGASDLGKFRWTCAAQRPDKAMNLNKNCRGFAHHAKRSDQFARTRG